MEGDDIFKLKARIEKAARNYFLTIVQDHELSDELLNQSLPKRYAPILEKIRAEELRKKWQDYLNKIFIWQRVVSQAV